VNAEKTILFVNIVVPGSEGFLALGVVQDTHGATTTPWGRAVPIIRRTYRSPVNTGFLEDSGGGRREGKPEVGKHF